jgi:hypothetical protein
LILKRAKKGDNFMKIFNDLAWKYSKIFKKNSPEQDGYSLFSERNAATATLIREQVKNRREKAKQFFSGGAAHFAYRNTSKIAKSKREDHVKEVKTAAIEKEGVDILYRALRELADENPFTVLIANDAMDGLRISPS